MTGPRPPFPGPLPLPVLALLVAVLLGLGLALCPWNQGGDREGGTSVHALLRGALAIGHLRSAAGEG